MKCPECGAECECEFVDIGVGMQQSSPYACTRCEWIQKSLLDEALEEAKIEGDL